MSLVGGTYRNGGTHPTAGFRWVQFDLPDGPKIELLTPVDPDDTEHFLNRFLAERGEGTHHVTFKVENLRRAVTALRELGFDVVGENLDNDGWKEAFVHPKTSHGLLIQIAEWDETVAVERPSLDDVLADRPIA